MLLQSTQPSNVAPLSKNTTPRELQSLQRASPSFEGSPNEFIFPLPWQTGQTTYCPVAGIGGDVGWSPSIETGLGDMGMSGAFDDCVADIEMLGVELMLDGVDGLLGPLGDFSSIRLPTFSNSLAREVKAFNNLLDPVGADSGC